MIPSLKWLQRQSATPLRRINGEQLRRRANSIEAMAQAWLTAPACLMSSGQLLVAALCLVERLMPERGGEAKRLLTALRRRQADIQAQYARCRLERDMQHYDIADRAACLVTGNPPRPTASYADVTIANARAATADDSIGTYLAAADALRTTEARHIAAACRDNPLTLAADTAWWERRAATTEPNTEEKQ